MNQGTGFVKIFLVAACLFFILALTQCRGIERVVMGGGAPPGDPPVYNNKGGPPPWAPAHGYRAKHRYRYYPSSRVYYEEERGTYFYYQDGHWKVSISLPSDIHVDMNDYVSLAMDSDEPYQYDHEVTKRYPPGQLQKDKKKKDRGKGKRKH